jgi:aryl-alcohol dehydrogenase-like predicted oxidoreductase
MIDGSATRVATKAHRKRFAMIQHAALGRTGLHCSQAGFGCYRIADGVDRHRKSLQLALKNGINLIDTSTNYADGASELLVGKVLAEMIQSGRVKREEIIVVTKVGYLQGHNFALSQARKAQGNPFPDLVTYADGLEHCIHPEFLKDQITRSRERLGLATIDFLLLHNPEYYLGWASRQAIDPRIARVAYERRIQQAFQYLAQEVDRGGIRYYGISANSFPNPAHSNDFTCLQRVLALALKTGPPNHFALIQFPMNLAECGAAFTANQPDGTILLATAHRAGRGVIINRPLNALTTNGLLRLADVASPRNRGYFFGLGGHAPTRLR